MPVLPVLLLLAAVLQDAAVQAAPEPWSPSDEPPALTQPSGPGLWIGGVAFTPEDFASVEPSFDGYTGVPIVILTFTSSGQAKFARAQQGRIEQVLEVTLDGRLLTAPILREPIAGNAVSIEGSFSAKEADRLATRIRGTTPPAEAPAAPEE